MTHPAPTLAHLRPCLGLIASILAACAAPLERAPAPLADVEYQLTLEQEPDLAVRIRLACQGDADGETDLQVIEGWGGVPESGADIHDLEVRDAHGLALEVSHPQSHRWVVRHAPGERLECRWRIQANDNGSSWARSQYYRPILQPGLFHMIGSQGLVHPAHLEGPQARLVSMSWNGFDQAGWSIVSSHYRGSGPHQLELPLSEMLHALYLGGELRVSQRDIHGRPLYVSIHPGEWGFTDARFADACARIVSQQRAFFDDFDYPHYLISVIPVGAREQHSQSMGGTGLTHSFAMFLTPGTGLAERDGEDKRVLRVLAHEMFHHWNGQVITLAQPEQLAYWFSEGFTDFYARRLLYRGGCITRGEYLDMLNERVGEYLLSPVREAPGSRVQEAFWTDAAVQSLPYHRGDVVAMLVDARIRRASGGTRSLDDLMRALVREAREREQPFEREELYQRVAAFSDAATAQEVREITENGALASIDASWFAPCLDLTLEERGTFDLGFDFEASRGAGRITGVREGSAAFEAGLRDGQDLAGASIQFGDASVPVEIQLGEGCATRQIRYLPVGTRRQVPVLRASEGWREDSCGFL